MRTSGSGTYGVELLTFSWPLLYSFPTSSQTQDNLQPYSEDEEMWPSESGGQGGEEEEEGGEEEGAE